MNEMLTLDHVPIEVNIYVFFALMCLNLPLHPSRAAGAGWLGRRDLGGTEVIKGLRVSDAWKVKL